MEEVGILKGAFVVSCVISCRTRRPWGRTGRRNPESERNGLGAIGLEWRAHGDGEGGSLLELVEDA